MGIRIGFMVIGAALVAFSFWKHCAKKLTVDSAVAWSLLGVCLILMGAVPALSEWINGLGPAAGWGLFCVGALLLAAGVHESMVISQLISENRELAMQVAMLNQENEAIKAEVERLAGTQGEEDLGKRQEKELDQRGQIHTLMEMTN